MFSVQWLPAVVTAAYGVLLAFGFERLLAAAYSSSDAASPSVITQCLGTRSCPSMRRKIGRRSSAISAGRSS